MDASSSPVSIMCKHGVYKNNSLIDDDGEELFVISYHSLNKEIEGKSGFFNMKKTSEKEYWIIFQAVLDEV